MGASCLCQWLINKRASDALIDLLTAARCGLQREGAWLREHPQSAFLMPTQQRHISNDKAMQALFQGHLADSHEQSLKACGSKWRKDEPR